MKIAIRAGRLCPRGRGVSALGLSLIWLATSTMVLPGNGQVVDEFVDDLSHGELWTRAIGWTSSRDGEDPPVPIEVVLEQELDVDLGEHLEFVLSLEAGFDNRHFRAGVVDEVAEESLRRHAVNLPEAYLQARFEHVDVVVGKKIWAWGTADGYNPTDNLNPDDLLDFLFPETIGVPSVGFTLSGGRSSFDLVSVPLFTPSRLPGEGNRWAVDLDPNSLLVGIGLDPATTLLIPGGRVLPEDDFSSQWAARFKLTLGPTDFELSIYQGWDPIPVAESAGLEAVPGAPELDALVVAAVFNEIEELGLAVAAAMGGVSWHAEASWRTTKDGHDDEFITWVVGASKSWYVNRGIEELRMTAQWIDEYIVEERQSFTRFATPFNRPFRDTILVDLVGVVSSDLELGLTAAVNIDEGDHMIQAAMEWRISDRHRIEIGAHALDGAADTFWGHWPDNDRVYAEYRLFF